MSHCWPICRTNPSACTASAEPSTGITEQPTGEIPAEFTARVIEVTDGDTIDVVTGARQTAMFRRKGIDALERGQPFGNNSRETVNESIGGQTVRSVTHADHRSGRIIGDIYHDGALSNLTLVKLGMAWHHVKYAPDREDLSQAERPARQQCVGLWNSRHGAIPSLSEDV